MPKAITELYAWIVTEASGGEGLHAASLVIEGREMIVPLVSADRERVELLRDYALLARTVSGLRVRLCRFELVEEIEEL